MIRVQQVKCRPNHTTEELLHRVAGLLKVPVSQMTHYSIRKQSIDARKKPDIWYSYVVDVQLPDEQRLVKRLKNKQISLVRPVTYHFPVSDFTYQDAHKQQTKRPVIIGCGPAGLFCAYLLAKAGFCPILLERGGDVDSRIRDVDRFWSTGELKTESNVQFGEGGAGTFSDGKLNTLVKDKDGRNYEVLRILEAHGAPASILYENKPHIGTDILASVVKKIRLEIERLGGEVRFHAKVTGLCTEPVKGQEHADSQDNQISQKERISGLVINETSTLACERVVLAIGHSARDTFAMLHQKGVFMSAKSFAVGLRVEHPQALINLNQYGEIYAKEMPPSPYKVTAQSKSGRGVYSFCMCPGGYVVNASSEEKRLAINGMSYSDRGSRHANSAIIVAVTPEDFASKDALAGVSFQRELEQRAYAVGGGRIPVERLVDFRLDREPTPGGEEPCMKGAYTYAHVRRIMPEPLNIAFLEGMEQFGRMIPGFDADDVLVSGIESRTSSPVRIHRDEAMQSTLRGLYPCGEGAGYAGGITSAAMDGMRIAEQLALEIAAECR